ncbi:MAG: VOC family protein [Planctomycetes bacterium]|nr:VOC family protein [Planctomycetota bacterium]
MSKIQPIPEGFTSVTPHIIVKDIKNAVAFYQKAFGAEACHIFPGPDGKPMHGDIKIGNAHVMLSPENPQWQARGPLALGGTPVTLALYVTDVDASFKRAVDAGAKPVMPPADMFWGDRFSVVTDPEGHSWSIATHTKDPSPEQMMEEMKKMGPC